MRSREQKLIEHADYPSLSQGTATMQLPDMTLLLQHSSRHAWQTEPREYDTHELVDVPPPPGKHLAAALARASKHSGNSEFDDGSNLLPFGGDDQAAELILWEHLHLTLLADCRAGTVRIGHCQLVGARFV
jgi:hypothetical protein